MRQFYSQSHISLTANRLEPYRERNPKKKSETNRNNMGA